MIAAPTYLSTPPIEFEEKFRCQIFKGGPGLQFGSSQLIAGQRGANYQGEAKREKAKRSLCGN